MSVYELQNATPSEINQVLQDLFNRNGTMRNNNNNRNSLLGDNNALTARQTQQQNVGNSGFGGNLPNVAGQTGTATPGAGF